MANVNAIMIIAAALRLVPFIEFANGSIIFTGTCGQLIDEVRPLVNSNNLLNFEYFYYPTVGPLIVDDCKIDESCPASIV